MCAPVRGARATLKSESIWTWMVGQELVDVPVKLDPKGRMPVTRL